MRNLIASIILWFYRKFAPSQLIKIDYGFTAYDNEMIMLRRYYHYSGRYLFYLGSNYFIDVT